jgi:branched-chain amino acid transport system substrate-binding protein
MTMKKTILILSIVLACMITLPLAGADIKIGLAEALTGGAAKYGVVIKNGFVQAANEINAKGGINGNKIVLVIEDEQGVKEQGISVFKKLINQDKVLLIFGPTLSNSAFAADPIAVESKVVVFATSNTANGITDMGSWVFRDSIMEADVLPVTLREASKKFSVKKVAVIYGNDDAFTKSGYDVFKQALTDQKIEVTATETFAKGDLDFRAQLTKIKTTKPDAIVASALAEEAANIILQARALGIKVPFIGGNGFNSQKLFDIAKDAAEGTIMGGPWSAESETPTNKAFIAGYTKAYTDKPDQFAAQGYDAMYIVAKALESVKLSGDIAKDRDALRLALPAVKIEGATGHFEFRKAAKGGDVGYDAKQDAHVFISKGGKFVLLK